MMDLDSRLSLLGKLREYISSDDENWNTVKVNASHENPWFVPEFIDFQLNHIYSEYLDEEKLSRWINQYEVPVRMDKPKKVGIVMAGNIPLAGFHDFLTAFISGHKQYLKPSSKDMKLMEGIVKKIYEWEPSLKDNILIADQLKGCDAYIATGSNNSSRYFEYYFSKYPHIIRRNRTSVAILSGKETVEDLAALADDVYLYFGLGCRNVTKIYVPAGYDFVPLLETFKKYNWTFDVHKYKNNFDYQLAVMIINKLYYMSNGSLLLRENSSVFSPIGQLHYEYYNRGEEVEKSVKGNTDIQCIVGNQHVPFGMAQRPALNDYADKADTLQFLLDL